MSQCRTCGIEMESIKPKRPDRKYCGRQCALKGATREYQKRNPRLGVPAGTVGAIHELLACADLLRKGFDVFRALSPSSSCDAAIIANGKLYRIEVTTGCFSASGKIQHPLKRNGFDILAIVFKSGEIQYVPSLKEVGLEII